MRNLTILKLSILVIVVGFAIGGWRSWRTAHLDAQTGANANITQVELLTTADKASWMRSQVFRFNYDNDMKWQVTVHYLDSRAAMERLLGGGEKPVLWSPESPIWIARANDVWRQRNNSQLVDMQDASSFRIFLRSPLVFLTTREKAAYLRQYLAGAKPWMAVHDMCTGALRPPWGRLRFSQSDPLQSNSGIGALAMILSEYADNTNATGSLQTVANDPKFGIYLGDIGRGLVYDDPCRKGTLALTDAYTKNIGSRDFIVTYENLALSAASTNKDLVVIYPNPTETSDQSVGIIEAPWVTADQRTAAQAFMEYIGRADAINFGLHYNMRPAVPDMETSLDNRLAAYGSQGFRQTYATEETPPYSAINAAVAQWHTHVGS